MVLALASRGRFQSVGAVNVAVKPGTKSNDTMREVVRMIQISSMSVATAICFAVTMDIFAILGSSHGTAAS